MTKATTPESPDLRALPDPSDPRATAEAILFEIRRVIVGQDAMLERILVGLLAGGHLLLEGRAGSRQDADDQDPRRRPRRLVPAHPVHARTSMPSDLVGTRIYRPDRATFETELGPVFANFLLADEINRAPAKVQSALLEVMQERQVTIGHDTHQVPDPFLVLATENPIEAEGTYPLPEAQVDRFMLKIRARLPEPGRGSADRRPLARAGRSSRATILDADGLRRPPGGRRRRLRRPADHQLRRRASSRRPASSTYWGAGRPRARTSRYGASPRGSINLVHGARALALLRGRRYVLPSDVTELAPDVLRHRLVLSYAALADGITARHHRRAGPRARPGAAPRDGASRSRRMTRRSLGLLDRLAPAGATRRPTRARPDRRRRSSPRSSSPLGPPVARPA